MLNLSYKHNRILCQCKKIWNIPVCCNLDGSRDQHGKWNDSVEEGQILADLIHSLCIERKTQRNSQYQTMTNLGLLLEK